LFSADILRTRGVLQMRTSTLFGAKNFVLFENYGVSARQYRRRLNQFGNLAGKELIFSPFFFADIFYRQSPIATRKYVKLMISGVANCNYVKSNTIMVCGGQLHENSFDAIGPW